MTNISKDQILDGIRRAYRTLPAVDELKAPTEETMVWISQARMFLGFANASINTKLTMIQTHTKAADIPKWHREIRQIFIDAITKLELETGGYAFAVEQGNVFDYFDETRKILEEAKSEIYLVDPYVSADIVGDYFKAIDRKVSLRVLTSKKQSAQQIVPAARCLTSQNSISIAIRGADNLHDRFWFIDGAVGYQSSSSVKDGGKKSPALIMKISDAFDAVLQMYEEKWNSGTVLL